MKLVALLLFCLVATVLTSPIPSQYSDPENVQVLIYENEYIGPGKHRYSFEQSDGTQQEQEGKLKNAGTENEIYVVRGSFSWVAPDGEEYTVHYVADENGYQPETPIGEGPGTGLPYEVFSGILG
ncbi:endocuticle structural protein SgAbd-6-like [Manduca sexta]|uniref:endocuticle structural protein SgAbd-6-like n=1 Tax=Manduca sexta TaxID=7130 RepID=UPI00188DF051|nr:endocuticle structural protein SgAbd-6-like [Manduca sexta]